MRITKTLLAVCSLALSGLVPVRAQITYVDAVEGAAGNTFATGGSLADTSWIDTTSNASAVDDSAWMKRSGGSPGWTEHNGGDVMQALVSGYPNTVPEVTTEITGLADGYYDVWVFFWEQTVSATQDWVIDTGLASGSLTSYSSSAGPVVGTDSSTPVDANTLSFSNAPSVTAAGGNQTMFGINLGQVAVSGGSSIEVYVDKLLGVGSNNRTIFDGVGYEYTGPLVPPALVSTDPVDDEPAAVATQDLLATFDVPVQAGASGNVTLKRTSDDSTVEVISVTDTTPPGTVVISGDTVTIDPTDDLVPGTEYYVLIDANAIEAITSVGYPGISDTEAWSFTVDSTAPSGTGMLPLAGAIGIQPGADLSLSFDEDVIGVSGKFITVYLTDGTPVETIDASTALIAGGQVTIPVSIDLGLGNSYYVTVESGAFTDLSGNAFAGFAGSTAWTFVTALADITYIDAVPGAAGNTYATGSTLADTTWVGPDASGGSDTVWNERSGLESNGDYLYQGLSDTTPPPELTTEISGLPDGIYTIWGFYWDQIVSDSQNWTLSAGFTSGSLTTYSSPGEPEVEGATTDNVINAGALSFTSPVDVEAAFDGSEYLRNLFGVEIGKVEVSGGSAVSVHIGSNLSNGSINRTWYDGVGYQLVAGSSRITSITPVGGSTWELTLQGLPDTAYEFRESANLVFDPGALVTGLTQGDPGDPGTVGGGGDRRLTTDSGGNGTVRMTLAGSRNFVRAQLPPPLLSVDFEADGGGFTVATTQGTAWAWGDPDSTGFGGTVSEGAGGSVNCWGTGIGNPGYYVDPTDTCLRSTVIDLTGVTAAELSFAMALDLEGGDSVTVNIIDDTTDAVIASDIVSITDTDTVAADWETVGPIAIPAGALGQPVRVEWCLSGVGGGTDDYLGWYIDNVTVTDTSP
ncbi:Ig-like domain-containing protein [Haloferula helveola]